MRKIEDFGVMESFGMDEITVDDMFDIDAACFIDVHGCGCFGKNEGDNTGNKPC